MVTMSASAAFRMVMVMMMIMVVIFILIMMVMVVMFVLIFIMMVVMMLMLFIIILYLIEMLLHFLHPCGRSDSGIEIEKIGIEELCEFHITVVTLYYLSFRVESADYLAYTSQFFW